MSSSESPFCIPSAYGDGFASSKTARLRPAKIGVEGTTNLQTTLSPKNHLSETRSFSGAWKILELLNLAILLKILVFIDLAFRNQTGSNTRAFLFSPLRSMQDPFTRWDGDDDEDETVEESDNLEDEEGMDMDEMDEDDMDEETGSDDDADDM